MASVIKVKILRWRECPGASAMQSSLEEEQERVRVREGGMMMDQGLK